MAVMPEWVNKTCIKCIHQSELKKTTSLPGYCSLYLQVCKQLGFVMVIQPSHNKNAQPEGGGGGVGVGWWSSLIRKGLWGKNLFAKLGNKPPNCFISIFPVLLEQPVFLIWYHAFVTVVRPLCLTKGICSEPCCKKTAQSVLSRMRPLFLGSILVT